MFVLVAFSFFCTFTVLGAPDIDLIMPGSKISVPIPFGSYSMPFTGFITVGPIVLLGITAYLHAILQHWRSLHDVPELHRMPYLFNLPYRSSRIISHLLFYWLTPLVLLVFYWKVIPLRDSKAGLLLFAFGASTVWSLWLQIRHCPPGGRGWNIPRWLLLLGFLWMGDSFGLALNPGLNLRGADLSGKNLKGRDFTFADLSETTLKEANMSHAKLRGAKFRNVNLSKANLSDANMVGALLDYADLSEANLENTSLDGASFYRANMVKARVGPMNKGTLTKKDIFNWSEVISFKLRGEDIYALTPWPELELVEISKKEQSEKYPLDLIDAKMANADLHYAVLNGVLMQGADLSKANLSVADLSESDLSGAVLVDADLQVANLTHANLADANLSRANLMGAKLGNANLGNANLSNANLSTVNFAGTNLTGANLSGANLAYPIPETALKQAQLDSACANTPIKKLPAGLNQPPPCAKQP